MSVAFLERPLGQCVRCFNPTPATTRERMSFGGDEYDLDLCEQHADRYQQDMFGWVRYGRIQEQPSRFDRRRREDEDLDRGQVVVAHIAVPQARQAEPEPEPREVEEPAKDEWGLTYAQQAAQQMLGVVPEGFELWRFSEHALERQEARGISRIEALWAAADPSIVAPGNRPGTLRHRREHVEVIVNPAQKRIITVINKNIVTDMPDMPANTPKDRRHAAV